MDVGQSVSADVQDERSNGVHVDVGQSVSAEVQAEVEHTDFEASDNGIFEDDCECFVCSELYSNSRPNEQWIKCMHCNRWAHEDCTAADCASDTYMCDYCQE